MNAAMSQTSDPQEVVLKEGHCVKKSGNRGLLGQYRWQRRWFVLIQRGQMVKLYYYEKQGARSPKGQIQLSNKYVTREPEGIEREKPHCFEVGPFADDGTTRTYYISCESEDDKHEWMEVLNAATEGVTAKTALVRKQTASFRAKKKKDRASRNSSLAEENTIKRDMYLDAKWRTQQWETLEALAVSKDWNKSETKDGITISRMSFSKQPLAIVKVEGLINAKCRHVYSFLQKAIQPGGKLDFPFRGMEDVLDKLQGHPKGVVVDCYKEIKVLPNTQPRYVTLLQLAVPPQLTRGRSCGVLVMSVRHPDSQAREDAVECIVGISGCVIKPQRRDGHAHPTGTPGDSDSEDDEARSVVSHLTLVGQVNLQGSLQTILTATYKSGLLIYGMRSFFQNLTEHIDSYVKIVDI